MTDRSASNARRPWWRLHVTTLLALAVVGSALGYCESQYHYGSTFGTNLLSTSQFGEYGWPLSCLFELTTTDNTLAGAGKTVRASVQSDAGVAVFDLAAVLAMLISTAVACEVWRRRRLAWWQFSVRSLFVLTAVGAVVATLYSNVIHIGWWRSEHYPDGANIYRCGLTGGLFDPIPWYVATAMLFGIGCAVFTAGWVAWNVSTTTWRFLVRICFMNRQEVAPPRAGPTT